VLGLETEWGAWQFDELCAIVGTRAEGNLMQGKPVFDGLGPNAISTPSRGYRSAKTRVIKKMKIPANGIW